MTRDDGHPSFIKRESDFVVVDDDSGFKILPPRHG
jgi:hypothetical protein